MADEKLKHWMNVWDDAQKKIDNPEGGDTQQEATPPPAEAAPEAAQAAEQAPTKSPAVQEKPDNAAGGQEG